MARPAPNPDRDGDGIPNRRDRCPDKPETVNQFQDKDGCPDVSPVKVMARRIVLTPPIRYTYGGPNLICLRSRRLLGILARVLKARPEVELVEIQVHTDNRGGRRYKLKITTKRANDIRALLIKEGVAANRLVAKGYGASKRLCRQIRLAECRRRNRRTVLVILRRRPPLRRRPRGR